MSSPPRLPVGPYQSSSAPSETFAQLLNMLSDEIITISSKTNHTGDSISSHWAERSSSYDYTPAPHARSLAPDPSEGYDSSQNKTKQNSNQAVMLPCCPLMRLGSSFPASDLEEGGLRCGVVEEEE
eukprot:1664696-Pleurochrysis_carterae.AAC.1